MFFCFKMIVRVNFNNPYIAPPNHKNHPNQYSDNNLKNPKSQSIIFFIFYTCLFLSDVDRRDKRNPLRICRPNRFL